MSQAPIRELDQDIGAAVARHWKAKAGDNVTLKQSHGGSGKHGGAVIDGLPADVATLALAYDIDAISEKGLIAPGWQGRLAHRGSPCISTIVFLVRKGKPKKIRDWVDLVKPGVAVITSNPTSSGGAHFTHLAARSTSRAS